MEEIKKAILELLRIRKNHCISMTELRLALEKKLPDKYPKMPELYKIVRELELEGRVEFHKAGELFLEGMIPEDSVALPGGDCIPEKYKVKVEKEDSGISKELSKKISKVDLHVSQIRDDLIDIKKDIERIKEDTEMTKDMVFDIHELLKKKGG